MGKRATSSATMPSAAGNGEVLADTLRDEMEGLLCQALPEELRPAASALQHAVKAKVAVAEHFDAFCSLAFSKPEWAALASPMIADVFEEDEDLLAELARIPDLIIEMSSGEVTMTCMVASRWAARGETHRLSRLADSLVASHASKNVNSVEIMLALAATLAVTRHSRAEQLFNAALPLAGVEHQEAVADARLWLAAGRVVCSAPPEERDFWDERLRKPRAQWRWESEQEHRALETLAERLEANMEGAHLFKAVVPSCWWQLAQKLAEMSAQAAAARSQDAARPNVEARSSEEPHVRPQETPAIQPHGRSKPGRNAVFVLGWICGVIATGVTVLLLLLFKTSVPLTSGFEAQEAWRRENLARLESEMAEFASLRDAVKNGGWKENEEMLSGKSERLAGTDPNYIKLLVWLHLDPPQDPEVRRHVASFLLKLTRGGAISLWEELIYPGSANAKEIIHVARESLNDPSAEWSEQEKQRLESIITAKI